MGSGPSSARPSSSPSQAAPRSQLEGSARAHGDPVPEQRVAGATRTAAADSELKRARADVAKLQQQLLETKQQLADVQKQLEESRKRETAAFEAGRQAGEAATAERARFDAYASFARGDAEQVMQYVRRLRAGGLSVCVPKDRLPEGDAAKEPEGPQDGMARSRAFLCFLSARYLANADCDGEFRRAHDAFRGARFPVFIENPKSLSLPYDYTMMLTSVNWTVAADSGEAAANGSGQEPETASAAAAAPSAGPASAPPSHPATGVAEASAGAERLHDAFVSYAHRDASAVMAYVAGLERAGISVWVDRELLAGRRWMEDIARAMQARPPP
eukprot:tig00020563_g11182.t1